MRDYFQKQIYDLNLLNGGVYPFIYFPSVHPSITLLRIQLMTSIHPYSSVSLLIYFSALNTWIIQLLCCEVPSSSEISTLIWQFPSSIVIVLVLLISGACFLLVWGQETYLYSKQWMTWKVIERFVCVWLPFLYSDRPLSVLCDCFF